MIKITPALPDREWDRLDTADEAYLPGGGGVRKAGKDIAIWTYGTVDVKRESLPALIAIANDALHDDDPRKITREDVSVLRALASRAPDEVSVMNVERVADLLGSYLRPANATTTY
jgi:hypothetical protein